MTLNEAINLVEDIPTVKFYYSHYHNDKYPEVMAFDTKYKGRKGQKTYGEREDVLGWNLNYYDNKEDAQKSIQEINDFAEMLSKNKEEKYKRVKYFFPKQAELIRRYKKNGIKFLRTKGKDGLWHKGEI